MGAYDVTNSRLSPYLMVVFSKITWFYLIGGVKKSIFEKGVKILLRQLFAKERRNILIIIEIFGIRFTANDKSRIQVNSLQGYKNGPKIAPK